jgi:hypothetical protein
MSERDCPDVTFYKLSKIRSSNRLKTHGLATQHVLFSKNGNDIYSIKNNALLKHLNCCRKKGQGISTPLITTATRRVRT